MVPLAQESRAADPRPSPRGDSPGPGRGDVGACLGRSRGASRSVHGRRSAALSGGPRAVVPDRGAEPRHDHEEGTLPEATAVTPGRVGAALSRNAGILALSRTVVFLMRGQSVANHAAIASGSRWRGTRRGFCGVNPRRRSQTVMYFGLIATPNSWRTRRATLGPVHRSVGKPWSVGLSANQRRITFSWVRVNFGARRAGGGATRPAPPALRYAATQRRTERGSTSRNSATSSAEYPSRTRWTARRRRCSNSAGEPLSLIPEIVNEPTPSGHYFSNSQ